MTYTNTRSNTEDFSKIDSQSSNMFYSSPQPPNLPQIGQTRCYWMLLTSSLHFLALDPVLNYHLHEQASVIVGKPLLDFVHPEEQASAKYDLKCVLQDNTLHGSVTRVRYSRLSRVRRLLGYVSTGSTPPPYPPGFPTERVTYDDNYMAVDIVINWAADGVVLCFIHAAVDIVSNEDNDEENKNGWTNWCGTYGFDDQQIQIFNDVLQRSIPPLQPPRSAAETSHRVFQILRNEMHRPLLLTWPPDSHFQQNNYRISPSAQTLAMLAHDVQINTNDGTNLNMNATTSCTRRFKSLQSIPVSVGEDSKVVSIESIYIPHGSIIFACHKIAPGGTSGDMYDPQIRSAQYTTFNPTPNHYQTPVHHAQDLSDVSAAAYDLQYLGTSHQAHSQPYSGQWIDNIPQHSSPSWAYNDASLPLDSRSKPVNGHPFAGNWSNQGLSYADPNFGPAGSGRFQPPAYGQAMPDPAASHNLLAAPSAVDGTDGSSSSTSDPYSSATSRRRSPGDGREPAGSSTRNAGNPPAGIMRCASCKVTQSPEWRKGPNGKKELCNACGLRFARSRAKKDGVAPRRRKEKPLKGAAGAEPSLEESRHLYGRPLAQGPRRHDLDDQSSQFSESFDAPGGSFRHAHLRTSDRYGFHLASPSSSPPLNNGHFDAVGAQISTGPQTHYGMPSHASDYGGLHHAALAPVSMNGSRLDLQFPARSTSGNHDIKDKGKLDFDKDRMLLPLEASRSADFRFPPVGKGLILDGDSKKIREKADLVW